MLKSIELTGFKSFGKKTRMDFSSSIAAIVGPNGSGKSNAAEAFRFALGEQSMKNMRGKRGEDLLFNGTSHAPRANRASVKVILDNSSKFLDIEFPEVVIERVVHRDSNHEYFINGSQVRLKDVVALLSKANIGSGGHHIISQGDSDKLLRVNPRERREMIEDALGLKVYHLKKKEALSKLEKSEENLKEIKALKRELVPHFSYLERQVKKIEESKLVEEELKKDYKEYFALESGLIVSEETHIQSTLKEKRERFGMLEQELAHRSDGGASAAAPDDIFSQKRKALESKRAEIQGELGALDREVGRVEGELRAYERSSHVAPQEKVITLSAVRTFISKLRDLLTSGAFSRETLLENLNTFEEEHVKSETSIATVDHGEKAKLQERLKELEAKRQYSQSEIQEVASGLSQLEEEEEARKREERSNESEMIEKVKENERLRSEIERLNYQLEALAGRTQSLKQERVEIGVLLGKDVVALEVASILREGQREARERVDVLRNKTMRNRIRLEEMGVGDFDETMKEYDDVKERIAFLESEIGDLESSRSSLLTLVEELDEKLEEEFLVGIEKISESFNTFFVKIFGGGSAALSLKKEKGKEDDLSEETNRAGVEIEVTLPRKRLKGLHVLSGGERALTSIALLFAMASVNPPPFIILDETDAALDEANSRRYGDALQELARESQLILITHNRETMARADILYGITMGRDGISKLLSVKFDDAVEYAKT